MHTPRLTLPHPRMSYRKFVLDGLLQIVPHDRHPLIAVVRRLAEALGDDAELMRRLSGRACRAASIFEVSSPRRRPIAAERDWSDATPSDVPAFAEISASPSVDMGTTIKFMKARITAIRASLDESDGGWIVDDGWLPAELMAMAQRTGFNEFRSRVDEWKSIWTKLSKQVRGFDVVTPKLVAVLRGSKESP